MKFCRSIEKDHAWKDSGVMTKGRRELEVGTLLLSKDKNNVISKAKRLKYKLLVLELNNNY